MITNDTEVIFSTWGKAQKSCRLIRETVFIDEQKVPPFLEWDHMDETSTHIILIHKTNHIGCARIYYEENYIRLERMAVYKVYRRLGFGSFLIKQIISHMKKNHIYQIVISAQATAIPFYLKHGFLQSGDTYMDANIKHQRMTLNISE